MTDPDDDEEQIVPLDDTLVAAFWKHNRLEQSDDLEERIHADQWWWACSAVMHAATYAADGVVELLVALADAVAGDLDELAYLGAGPFAGLLRYGDQPPTAEILDKVDEAAQNNDNVRLAVRAVRWNEIDDPQIVERFTRFGPPY